ncbi:hypothetical protein [Neobacillus jeddahensis]|uniref:hypothetical protein n=1 Tax=Neobacillus jeddahensis TaxID=1461580 RepID=UPI0005A999F7|nr:hypothetical protein [Neobacillus jeddahensis]
MYCVIQKVTNKKPNPYGHYKELMVDWTTITYQGKTETKYSYRYSNERFERPVKDAYKISIHKSYRENGKVKKKQWVICTMGYYDIAKSTSWAGDYLLKKELNAKLKEMGIPEAKLWDMVYQKLDPIIEQVNKEFEATDEYKTKAKHDEILKQYHTAKSKFDEMYGSDAYDHCYDLYGTLRNPEYLEQLIRQKREEQEYFKRSYENNYKSNYSNYDFGGYSTTKQSNYTNEEKGMLKKIYREASKKFHPDVTNDDGSMMKFLTRLKEEWGI